MQNNQSKINRAGLYYAFMGIPVVANAIVSIFLNYIMAQVLSGTNFAEIYKLPQSLYITINIVPFIFAMITIGAYVSPVLKSAEGKPENGWNEVSVRRLGNAAMAVGAFTFIAWMIPVLEVYLANIIGSYSINWYNLLTFGVINILLGIMSSMICYFGVDFIISKYYLGKISKIFPLASIPGLYYISIRTKFVLFLVSISLAPLFLVSFALFIAHETMISNNLAGNLAIPVLFFVAFGFSSVVLTLHLAGDFHNPITKLGDAANQISRGNFNVNIPFLKTDEIGKLTERFNEMSVSLQEKEFIKDTFGKAVDPRVRDFMLKGNFNPGGELKTATVLFSDIRSFTSISENLSPAQVVNLLNQYFEKMSHCIVSNGGIVNKYIGDSVMAIFGAPIETEDHGQRAFDAALSMVEARNKLNEDLKAQGLPEIHSGIGIHSGQLLSGNIGSKDRLEYTVIGDTVNLSSRIESLCKKLNHDFLISSDTYELLDASGKKQCRYQGKVKVKGKENFARIYSVHY